MEMLPATKGVLLWWCQRKPVPQTDRVAGEGVDRGGSQKLSQVAALGAESGPMSQYPKAHSDLHDHGLQGGLPSCLYPLCPCWPQSV